MKPMPSNGRLSRLAAMGVSVISNRPVAASANGTTQRKIQVQDWLSISQPCRAGARVAEATTAPMANTACKKG
ncbi:hypothetical protein D3C77_490940 [compost metagenome]